MQITQKIKLQNAFNLIHKTAIKNRYQAKWIRDSLSFMQQLFVEGKNPEKLICDFLEVEGYSIEFLESVKVKDYIGKLSVENYDIIGNPEFDWKGTIQHLIKMKFNYPERVTRKNIGVRL